MPAVLRTRPWLRPPLPQPLPRRGLSAVQRAALPPLSLRAIRHPAPLPSVHAGTLDCARVLKRKYCLLMRISIGLENEYSLASNCNPANMCEKRMRRSLINDEDQVNLLYYGDENFVRLQCSVASPPTARSQHVHYHRCQTSRSISSLSLPCTP